MSSVRAPARADTDRRKHAAQNRDMAQANALALARIRELETRVFELEHECAEHRLAAGRQTAHIRRLEYRLDCVRVGWESMAHAVRDSDAMPPLATPERTQVLPTPPQLHTARITFDPAAPPPSSRLAVSLATPLAAEGIAEEDEAEKSTPLGARASPPASEAPPSAPVGSTRSLGSPPGARRRRSRRYSGVLADGPPLEAASDAAPSAEDGIVEPVDEHEADHAAVAAETADTSADSALPNQLPHSDAGDAQSAAAPDAAQPREASAPRKRSRSSLAAELGTPPDLPDLPRRARKSINYALPKLNTKMRKPDADGAGPARKRRATNRRSSAREGSADSRESSAEPADSHAPEAADTQHPPAGTSPDDAPEPQPPATPTREPQRSGTARRASPPRNVTPQVRRATPFATKPAAAPFTPSRGRHSASVLQQHSAQNMPSWASSLLNLSSPEPPQHRNAAAGDKENARPARTRRT